ncbi:hypothetical protein GCM10010502_52020 [Kitasatospora aureofaciens]|uniref:Uncharacterized protein n=1 Tax=Kitasatospora aureofaciens TaxID=1894 RepID=A0A8H9LX61_KITAU|nr:hypothetical protein GCM10010502_52020 [Kitasatospora aureofaciens]
MPQARAGALGQSGPGSRHRDVGAREPGDEDADRLDGAEVDLGDITQVGDAGPVVLQDGRGAGGRVRVPGDLAAEDGLHAQVEAAVARAQ